MAIYEDNHLYNGANNHRDNRRTSNTGDMPDIGANKKENIAIFVPNSHRGGIYYY